jgi:hypothetical protein
MSIRCSFCDAEPGRDCMTTKGAFAAIHVQRIKEAAKGKTQMKAQPEG